MVFAGSDGTFRSAWQLWKRQNHEPESFVIASGDTIVFRTTTDGGDCEYVWYVGIDEDELPEGVYQDGVVIRDTRSEE